MRGLTARCETKYAVKNCCTSAANEGALGAVSSRMGHLPLRHERLELACSERHEFGHGAEVPIGVGDHRVPDVGRQRQHRLIDINALCVPLHDAMYDEGVSQIVDTRCVVSSSVAPAQMFA